MSRQSYIFCTVSTAGTESFAPGRSGYVLKITKMVFTNTARDWTLSLLLDNGNADTEIYGFSLKQKDVQIDNTVWEVGANTTMKVKLTSGTSIYVTGYYEQL